MKNKLLIIGGGASSIAFIDAVNNIYSHGGFPPLDITVIDKGDNTGAGSAYQRDIKSNLLNTKAGYITALKGRSGDFFQWLEKNKSRWQGEFGKLTIDERSYAPRPLFGMYMNDTFNHVIEKSRDYNIHVDVVRDEAVDVIEDHVNNVIKTKLSDGSIIISTMAVIACGTLSRSPYTSPSHPKIHHSPYPINQLCKKIDTKSCVGVIGSRLSAIDTVIGHVESGHVGEIIIYSRSGLFPSVRGTQERYRNHYLSLDYIKDNYPNVSLADLSILFYQEMDRYNKQNRYSVSEVLKFPKAEIDNIERFIDREIELSVSSRGWQAVLYDTNAMLGEVWNMLTENDKQRFVDEMLPSAMSMRVSIPVENAIKIRQYLSSGQLSFVAGASTVNVQGDSLFVQSKSINKKVNDVIYATGSPRDVQQSDSTLIKNLISSGTARTHALGGVDVCKQQYGVFDRHSNRSAKLFAIGEITNGSFLFTSALDIIVNHAAYCAQAVIMSLSRKQHYNNRSSNLSVPIE